MAKYKLVFKDRDETPWYNKIKKGEPMNIILEGKNVTLKELQNAPYSDYYVEPRASITLGNYYRFEKMGKNRWEESVDLPTRKILSDKEMWDLINETYFNKYPDRVNDYVILRLPNIKAIVDSKFKDSEPDWETLKKSKDFVLKRLFKELEEEKAKPMSIEQENNIADIKSQIRKRAKEIRHVPNDIYDADPRPVSEIAKHLNVWIDAFLDNDDELSDEYRKPFRRIQKDSRLLNKVANELKTQFDALDLDLNNLEDAPDISRIIWREMKRFTRR